ncbi:MAG: hypothetical protein ACI9EM_000449 [Candidatus Thalassarchaeaceae archaeon]|jgi:hypothetical protein
METKTANEKVINQMSEKMETSGKMNLNGL